MIAIVDDDAFVRDALEDLLTSFGHRVRAFHCAEDFLQSGTTEDTSCLITDLQMPGMSGLDLQQRLLDNGHGTPVIFLTAFPEERARALAVNRGALAFLKKPFQEVELISHLDRALKAGGEQNKTRTPSRPQP